jgi:hypothetical protein
MWGIGVTSIAEYQSINLDRVPYAAANIALERTAHPTGFFDFS